MAGSPWARRIRRTGCSLLKALEAPELGEDPRFAENAGRMSHLPELAEALTPFFQSRSSAEWLDRLQKAGVPAGPVLDIRQMHADPQALAREMIVETVHPSAGNVKAIGLPMKFSETPGRVTRPAPRFGQDTRDVLTRGGLHRCGNRSDGRGGSRPDGKSNQAGQTMSENILYEIKDGIGRITFNRPEARNAFTLAMYEQLHEIVQQAQNDSSVRVLVLTGAGDKAFAAGTDISEFKSFSTPEDALNYEAQMDRVLSTLERSTVPTIAAIAGCARAEAPRSRLAAIFASAPLNARFGLPIARTLGNCLSMANYVRLAALIGPARLKDIIFTARLIEAPEAHAIGLLSEVLPDHASLQTRAEALARTVAAHAPLTLRVTKEALRLIQEKMTPEQDPNMILTCYMSRDFREGMDAFLNKRPPNWKGE